MSANRSLSHSFVPWEYRILIALLLILGGFYFMWEVILEDELPQQDSTMTLNEPPTLIPWRENPPIFLQNVQIENVGNPFATQFPLAPKAVVVDTPDVQPPQVDTPEPPEPPPPPPHTLTITFKGVRVSLTGKTFAILDIDDSETGKDSFYKQEGDTFASNFTIQSITEKTLVLKGPDSDSVTEVSFGEKKIFTLKANE